MAMISKRWRNEALILTSFSISKRNEPADFRICKDPSEANPAYFTNWTGRSEAKSVYSTNSKERCGANSIYSTNWTDRSKAKSVNSTNLKGWCEAKSDYYTNLKNQSAANSAFFRNRQDWSEKNELDWSKTNRGGILKLLWSPGIDSKEFIPPAYALAGLYNNPIPDRFLALLDCSKAP